MKTDEVGSQNSITRFLINRYEAFCQKEGQVATRTDWDPVGTLARNTRASHRAPEGN